jgi:hypothetical protein
VISINTIKNKLSLNATTLKILAVILMILDHVHQMWAHSGAPMWLKCLGRPVFPIFLFVLSESFHYTHNRKNFLKRLLFASWFMTVFNIILQYILPNDDIVLMNNAFSTFFITGLYMLFYDMLINGIKTRKVGKMAAAILLCLVPIITSLPVLLVANLANNDAFSSQAIRIMLTACLLLPNILLVEGGFILVILGVLFYTLRKWRWAQIAVLTTLSALVYINANGADIQWFMVFAAIPMLLYNGEKGRGMKNFFYIFYPAHIYLFYIIATLWR